MKHAFHSCYRWTCPRQVWVQLEKGKKWGLLNLPLTGNRSLAHSFSCSGERPGKGLGSWEHWDVIISMSSFARHSNSRKQAPPGPLGKVCKLFCFPLRFKGESRSESCQYFFIGISCSSWGSAQPYKQREKEKEFCEGKTKNSLFEIFFSSFFLSASFSWFNLIRICLVSRIYFLFFIFKKQTCKKK